MQCPVCNAALVMSDRNGIEIDYCPQCRGVWLDRGELDKIIERSGTHGHQVEQTRAAAPQQQQVRRDYDDDDERYRHDSHNQPSHHGDHHKKHKKEGFLGDLFDF